MEIQYYIGEIWLPIKGFEGLYEVSNFGRVRSLDICVWRGSVGKGCRQTRKGKILTPVKNKDGYLMVCLKTGDFRKNCVIHRLVAEAFIPNPHNYPCVNHKNENKTDNRVENLEWCTVKYNNTYGGRLQKMIDRAQKVNQYTLDGIIIRCWDSAKQAAEAIQTTNCKTAHQQIRAVCNLKRKTAYGFIWRYDD